MSIVEQINVYVDDYKVFMGIDYFPQYNLQTKSVSLAIADAQGFEVAAGTGYEPLTGRHTLTISTNLNLERYLAFHEFTHMYDSDSILQDFVSLK